MDAKSAYYNNKGSDAFKSKDVLYKSQTDSAIIKNSIDHSVVLSQCDPSIKVNTDKTAIKMEERCEKKYFHDQNDEDVTEVELLEIFG